MHTDSVYLKKALLDLKNAIENKENIAVTDVPERLKATFGKKEKKVEEEVNKADKKKLAMALDELNNKIDSMVLSYVEDFEQQEGSSMEYDNLYLY